MMIEMMLLASFESHFIGPQFIHKQLHLSLKVFCFWLSGNMYASMHLQ